MMLGSFRQVATSFVGSLALTWGLSIGVVSVEGVHIQHQETSHHRQSKVDIADGLTTDFIKLAVHEKKRSSSTSSGAAVLGSTEEATSQQHDVEVATAGGLFKSTAGLHESSKQSPGSAENSLDVYAMNPYMPGPGTVIRNLRFGAQVKLIQATVLGFIRGSAPFEALKSKLRGEFENTNYVSRFYDNTTVDGKLIVSGEIDCRDSVMNDGIRTTSYVTLENCRVNGMIECNGWNTGITSVGPNNVFESANCQIWNEQDTNVRKTILDTFGLFWIILGVFLVLITCGAVVMTDDTGVTSQGPK